MLTASEFYEIVKFIENTISSRKRLSQRTINPFFGLSPEFVDSKASCARAPPLLDLSHTNIIDSTSLASAMNVYVLLIVIFSVAFAAPILKWLYINYFASLLRWLFKLAVKLKRKVAARKSKFQKELEKIYQEYGLTNSAREAQEV